MIRIRAFTAAALVAGLLAGGTAFAQGPRFGGPGDFGRRGGPGGRGLMGGLPLASLNLTQAQQDLIRDIRMRNRTDLQAIEGRLRTAQEAQRKAVESIPLNEALIRSTTAAVGDVQAEAAILQARLHNEIFAALTPDQQAQVQKALAEREARVQERRSQATQRRGRQ